MKDSEIKLSLINTIIRMDHSQLMDVMEMGQDLRIQQDQDGGRAGADELCRPHGGSDCAASHGVWAFAAHASGRIGQHAHYASAHARRDHGFGWRSDPAKYPYRRHHRSLPVPA